MNPTRRDPRLEAAIRAVPGWRGHHIGITPVSIGPYERHFLIEVDDELSMLRLAVPGVARPHVDNTDEVEIVRSAASAGVTPEVIASLPQLGCLVTRFAAGRRLVPADAERDEVLVSLVGSVRALHACPAPAAERSPFREADDLRRTALAQGVAMPGSEAPATEAVACIERALTTGLGAMSVCHGDLTSSSLFLDGAQVWIVDFRWAGAGDPFEDLGSVAAHLELREERCDSLLALYGGSVDDGNRSRLALMRLAAEYLAAMRRLAHAPSSGAIAERHLTRVIEGSRDERFERWLDAVA
jgi:aminoglycoside phosphotransferase